MEDETELLGDAGLDHPAVGGGLHGDGTAGSSIEEGDFLAKACLDILVADIPGDAIRGDGEEGAVAISDHETGDANYEEVQTVGCLEWGWTRVNIKEHTPGDSHRCEILGLWNCRRYMW